MYVDKITLLFEDLNESDVITLCEIELDIRNGMIPFDHPFLRKWFDAFGVEKDRLMVGSTVLHIRILQSVLDWMFAKSEDADLLSRVSKIKNP